MQSPENKLKKVAALKMRMSLGMVAFAGMAALAGSAHGETIQDLVNDNAGTVGPVYATFAWEVTSGSLSSGTFTITGLPLSSIFTPPYPTATVPTSVGPQNVTAINAPTSLNDPGVIAINVNAANPSADYLVEEIDLGYNSSHVANMQTIFDSVDLLGFGLDAPNVYWFGFQQGTGTSVGPAGALIGGLITNKAGGDIKVFDVAAPAPNSALGGLVLMGLVGSYVGSKKLKVGCAN